MYERRSSMYVCLLKEIFKQTTLSWAQRVVSESSFVALRVWLPTHGIAKE